jgi:hypothetical protein
MYFCKKFPIVLVKPQTKVRVPLEEEVADLLDKLLSRNTVGPTSKNDKHLKISTMNISKAKLVRPRLAKVSLKPTESTSDRGYASWVQYHMSHHGPHLLEEINSNTERVREV